MVDVIDKNSIIIVDGHYIEKISKIGKEEYLKIDFSKLKNIICEDDNCLNLFYYHCAPYNGHSEEEKIRYINKMKFFRALQMIRNCITRIGELQRVVRKDESFFFRKQIEIFMTMDMMTVALTGNIYGSKIDIIYFVSNNSNMIPVVKTLMKNGIDVIHVASKNLTQSEWFLNEFTSYKFVSNEILKQICLK